MAWQTHEIRCPWRGGETQVLTRVRVWSRSDTYSHVVVFFVGRGEYCEKYEQLPEDLELSESQALVVWDPPGQGGSDGLKGHVRDYEDYRAVARKVMAKFVDDRSYDILGHSMGSLTALSGVVAGDFTPRQMCLVAPFLGIAMNPYARLFLTQLVKLLVSCGFGEVPWPFYGYSNRFDGNGLTTDPDKFRRFIVEAPFPSPAMTLGWLVASDRVQRQVLRQGLPSGTNLSVILASLDSVVSNETTERWLSTMPGVKVHSLPGEHELYIETDSVYRDLIGIVRKALL